MSSRYLISVWGRPVAANQALAGWAPEFLEGRRAGVAVAGSPSWAARVERAFQDRSQIYLRAPRRRRKLASFAPALVLRTGRPWLAIGTPGGHTIPQTLPQMVMNAIDFGMDVQRAIAAPRIAFRVPDTLFVEPGIPAPVRSELERRGHRLGDRQVIGDGHSLTVEYDQHGLPVRFTGASDSRGEGTAEGVSRLQPQ